MPGARHETLGWQKMHGNGWVFSEGLGLHIHQHCGHESRFDSHGQDFNRVNQAAGKERNKKDSWRISPSLTPNKEEAGLGTSEVVLLSHPRVKWSGVEWSGGGA